MKYYEFLAGIILLVLAASCSNESELSNPSINNETLVPVRVHVDGFSATQEDFPDTRATAVSSYNGVNAVTVAFYNGSTEVNKTTQLKSSLGEGETFGEFTLSLPMGSYTMVVLAYYTNESSVLTLTSPTAASYNVRPRETFAKTQTVNIAGSNAVDISATLDRIISCLIVTSTDGKAADVASVRMTLSAGGMSFNPTTGLATSNTGFANTVSNTVAAGATSTTSTFLFLASDEQTMNVTIETLDADGNTLFSKTVNNVSFKRNRITRLTGAMYTNSGVTGSFQISNDWLSDSNVNF